MTGIAQSINLIKVQERQFIVLKNGQLFFFGNNLKKVQECSRELRKNFLSTRGLEALEGRWCGVGGEMGGQSVGVRVGGALPEVSGITCSRKLSF